LIKGFSVFVEPFGVFKQGKKEEKKPNLGLASKLAQKNAWSLYKFYKKSHRHLAW